nr:Cof-type HAD-IIB family hydrolase [Lederbergia galactosidilytica]
MVTDLDGTLLDDEQRISRKSERAIKEFQENGGIFTFATGRVQTSITSFIDQLNIQYPVITHNGAQIFCPRTKRILYRQSFALTDSIAATLATLAKLENIEIMYFMNEEIYTNEKGPLIQIFEAKEELTVFEQIPTLQNEYVTKIIIAHTNQALLTAIEQQINAEYPAICTTFSEPEYLELLPTNTSKGNALTFLKNNYLDPARQVITFGNNLNDIPLVSEADIGIAVLNAHPELKRVSTFVLEKTNQEDAIADYLEKLQLTKVMA